MFTLYWLAMICMNVAVDPGNRKLDKQIKTASKLGVHYVVFIGDEELASGQYKVKNLLSGKEEAHGVQRIVSLVKDYRHPDDKL